MRPILQTFLECIHLVLIISWCESFRSHPLVRSTVTPPCTQHDSDEATPLTRRLKSRFCTVMWQKHVHRINSPWERGFLVSYGTSDWKLKDSGFSMKMRLNTSKNWNMSDKWCEHIFYSKKRVDQMSTERLHQQDNCVIISHGLFQHFWSSHFSLLQLLPVSADIMSESTGITRD